MSSSVVSDSEARIRTNWVRFVLSKLAAVSPDRAAKVMSNLPQDTVELIENTPGICFIPFDCHYQVGEAMFNELGERPTVEVWAQAVYDACQSAVLFKGILATIATFFADRNHIVAKGCHTGWNLVAKGCGTVGAHGDGEGEWFGILWKDIPAQFARGNGVRAGWEGSIVGAYRALGDTVDSRSEILPDRQMMFWMKRR
jgi:hypothetical protein